MKKLKIILLSAGMALCAGGAIGAAIAFTNYSATIDDNPTADKSIQLYWGSGESSVTIDPVVNLGSHEPVFRYLDVSPKSTKTVEGTVRLDFTLAEANEDAVLTGLTVDVYEIAQNQKNSENIATIVASLTANPSLDATNKPGYTTFSVSKNSLESPTAHETNKYYVIKIEHDGSLIPEGKELTANLTVHQSFTEAA